MVNGPDPFVQLQIVTAVCGFFAIATTLYRLWIRRSRYWLDDAWAAFTLLPLVIEIISVFLHVQPPPSLQNQTAEIAVYYLLPFGFYVIIFSSRLSILFSIIRIYPGRRKLLYASAAFMIIALLVLMAQLLWVCEPEPAWKNVPNPQCHLGLQIAVSQLVTDIISDSILLLAPLTLLSHLVDRSLRRKLGIIFSTCVATTIVSIVHAAYVLQDAGIKVLISAEAETSISLIVANIPVVVTHILSLTGDSHHDHVKTYPATTLKFNQISSPGASKGVSTNTTGNVTTTVSMQDTERGMNNSSVLHSPEDKEVEVIGLRSVHDDTKDPSPV